MHAATYVYPYILSLIKLKMTSHGTPPHRSSSTRPSAFSIPMQPMTSTATEVAKSRKNSKPSKTLSDSGLPEATRSTASSQRVSGEDGEVCISGSHFGRFSSQYQRCGRRPWCHKTCIGLSCDGTRWHKVTQRHVATWLIAWLIAWLTNLWHI